MNSNSFRFIGEDNLVMLKWLNNAVFYEIYPISFFDSNGDGKGDLQGIIEKADYLRDLGINAVWINPIYKSPFKDGGYDISDYNEIDKRFGLMQDLENLIKVFHERGIKIVLDLVIGHTSDKHKWFKKSACAKKNSYWDYYVWTDNIFQNYPGLIRGLYYRDGGYLPNYYASQPALNYGFENPDPNHPWQLHYTDERLKPLREELLNMMRFYLDKGVDGFRVDLAGHLIKGAAKFDENNPFDDSDEGLKGLKWFWNQIISIIKSEYEEKVFIAEWVVPQKSIGKCGFDMDFLTHDTFAFGDLYRNERGLNLDPYYERGDNYFSPNGKGTLENFVKYAEYLYERLGDKGMFTAPTGTHDEVRMPTGKTPDMIKCIFAFMLTLKHIPLIYYGDEIGIEHNYNVTKDGGGIRTGARTPMQWTDGINRGFTNKKNPYLPTAKTKGQSVEAQEKDENSILNTVKDLIRIRKEYSALNVNSEQKFIETSYPAVYERSDGKQKIIVLINPSNRQIDWTIEFSKIIKTQNVTISSNVIKLKEQSFALLLK